jgi:hypothetical protein
MNYNSEEVGYAHEIINLSLKKAKDVLNRRYLKETKLLAFLVLKVTDKTQKGYKIQIDKKEEIGKEEIDLKVLYYICTNLKFLTGVYNDHQKKLKKLFQQYLERKSISAFDSFKESLEKAIVLHIISKELKEKNLIDKNFITQVSSTFSQDAELSGILMALQKLDKKPLSKLELEEIISKIHKITNFILLPIAVYLTFKLAMKSKEYKDKLLLEHFFLLKNLAQNFNTTTEEWENADDTSLKKLFTASILLYFCGYDTTLRIPHSEKLNYLKNVMHLPSVTLEFEKAYDECTTSRLLREIPLHLWMISLINVILILLSLLHEIYSPATLNFYVINFNLPSIPLFSTVSVLLSFYITIRLYRLKDEIIKKMRV